MKTALVGNVHLVAGNEGDIAALSKFLESEGIQVRGNPDVYVRSYKQFGVDEARELSARASLRAIGKNPRIFILSAATMTSQAQNAFLKTLEEPPADSMFFILVPSPEMLLPTLRSRAQRLELPRAESENGEESLVDAAAFLAATEQKRLDMLKPLLEKGEDDKRDIGAILVFLASLERAYAKSSAQEGVHAVYRARKYVTDKGALVKPLLEQVALLVPKI